MFRDCKYSLERTSNLSAGLFLAQTTHKKSIAGNVTQKLAVRWGPVIKIICMNPQRKTADDFNKKTNVSVSTASAEGLHTRSSWSVVKVSARRVCLY